MKRVALVFALAFAALDPAAAREAAVTATTQQGKVRLVTVAEGLERPWGVAFLPDGRALVTERPGRLRIVGRDGRLSAPLAGVPAVDAVNQGGLLDVALDPDFAKTRLVYLSYSEPREGGNGTAVARGRLGDAGLEKVEVIFRQLPTVKGGHHFGSRLVFARDGRLYRIPLRRNTGNLEAGRSAEDARRAQDAALARRAAAVSARPGVPAAGEPGRHPASVVEFTLRYEVPK
jgi:glucose/arabinose dehydrogenase